MIQIGPCQWFCCWFNMFNLLQMSPQRASDTGRTVHKAQICAQDAHRQAWHHQTSGPKLGVIALLGLLLTGISSSRRADMLPRAGFILFYLLNLFPVKSAASICQNHKHRHVRQGCVQFQIRLLPFGVKSDMFLYMWLLACRQFLSWSYRKREALPPWAEHLL